LKRKQLLITIAIVAICVLIDIVLHAATSEFSSTPEGSTYSEFAETAGIELSATLWALLAFSGATFVFFMIRNSIPGAGLGKGIRYGSALSLLWLFAMLEGVGLFGNELVNEFVIGLSDAIPAFILGVLLGLSMEKTDEKHTVERPALGSVLTVLIIAGIFLIGRYIAYYTELIRSGYETSPLFTVLWTALMGACIGIACLRLENLDEKVDRKRRALRFGILTFGVNWTTFLLFMPILFSGFLTDVATRIVLDLVLVSIGYYLISGPGMNAVNEMKR
jgi:hypothetical protein